MANYYDKNLDLTFSLYENKILYNQGSGSSNTKKECTQYWFNNQNVYTDLQQFSEISYKVSGSNSYVKDNNWNNSSNIIFTESDVVNHWFANNNTKNINDVVSDIKDMEGVGTEESKILVKEQFQIVKDWSI